MIVSDNFVKKTIFAKKTFLPTFSSSKSRSISFTFLCSLLSPKFSGSIFPSFTYISFLIQLCFIWFWKTSFCVRTIYFSPELYCSWHSTSDIFAKICFTAGTQVVLLKLWFTAPSKGAFTKSFTHLWPVAFNLQDVLKYICEIIACLNVEVAGIIKVVWKVIKYGPF